MVSLIFAACFFNGGCISWSPPVVFDNVEQCEMFFEEFEADVMHQSAPAPILSYVHKCVDWGEAA